MLRFCWSLCLAAAVVADTTSLSKGRYVSGALNPHNTTHVAALMHFMASEVFQEELNAHEGFEPALGEPRKPILPEQFTSHVTQRLHGMANIEKLAYYYDGPVKKFRSDPTPNHTHSFVSTTIFNATIEYEYFGGVCRQYPGGKFQDTWAFMEMAKYQGKALIDLKECDKWTYFSLDKTVNITLYTRGDTPVRLYSEMFQSFLPGAAKFEEKITTDFVDISRVAPAADKLSVPDACTEPPPKCTSAGVQVLDMYIAHPPEFYNISDQDTADALGDTLFTCHDVASGGTSYDHYGVVSHYEVEVNTTWGVYSLCNGYNPSVCFGPEPYYVGREASYGHAPDGHTGQCDPNDDIGSWYSMPSAGQCKHGHTVADGTCTWRVVRRVKTIGMKCVFTDQGMLKACPSTWGPHNYSKAMGIFLTAFEKDDLAEGGCPDVPPPFKLSFRTLLKSISMF